MKYKYITVFLVFFAGVLQSFSQTTTHPTHVIITAGQSNTDGRVKNTLLPAYIKALTTDSAFVKGSYRFCKISQNRNDGQFVNYWPKGRITDGLWTYDAIVYYKLEQLWQEDFYVVKYAVGGTSIQFPTDTAKGRYWSANPEWLKHTMSYEKKGNSLLLSFTESIDAAIDQTLSKLPNGYQIDAFLWHQGESDDVYADMYYGNLKQLIAYVRHHLTEKTGKDYSKLPFVFGSIPTANRHFKSEIDAAMKRITKEDSNAYLIDMSKGELQNDRTHFNEKSAEYLGNEMFKVLDNILHNKKPDFYVAKYRNDKTCAISYTFDDGLLEHATLVAPELEKLGFRGTFWVNGKTIDQNDSIKLRVSWKQLQVMSKNGHEISNHGWSHKNLNRIPLSEVKTEIQKNDSAIQRHTGKRPVTYCYAFNAKNDTVIDLASANRVGTRIKQFSVGGKSTIQNLDARVDELLRNEDWGVTMTHGITTGYDHFSNALIFWEHLAKVKKLEYKIWVGTFKEVSAYLKERDALTYDVIATKNGYIISPVLQLDKKLFNESLTGVLNVPDFRKIKISQKNKKLNTVILKDKICFDFNPYNGPIKITIN
jgi:peptidoglycan/xylan/chitin deacetylase (PgdA/CDA1 family)